MFSTYYQKPLQIVRLDWIEQGLTSPPTQYRLSGKQFYRSKDPTNSIEVLKEKLASHRPEEDSNVCRLSLDCSPACEELLQSFLLKTVS